MATSDVEVALAIAYAPKAMHGPLRALWAYDAKLADILRTTREPLIGQMRLTWWYDAVARTSEVAGEPILAALRDANIDPTRLQAVAAGWEALLEGDDEPGLQRYAIGRGGALFRAVGEMIGAGDAVDDAGAGWALVDLARHHSVPAVADRALRLAEARLREAPRRWSSAGRPLGILTKLARRDLRGIEVQGSPRRLWAAATLALSAR